MKVLITGANGLLAANTIRELNSRGIEVRGMVRKTSDLRSLEGATYEKVFGDITNYEDVQKAATGCDVIIHAAANTSQKAEDQKKAGDIEGVKNIIQVTEDLKINRLVYVSSANAFGYGSIEIPGTEKDPVGKAFRKSHYALNKLTAQNLVIEAATTHRIDAVVVNPTFIIGAHDARPSSGRAMLMYLNNKIAVYPPGGKNFVNASDAAKAICNAMHQGRSGESYLLAGENLTYKQFYRKVKSISGIEKPLIPIPKPILKLIGVGGSLINKIGGAAELTSENADILSIENYYSSKKAQVELDMPQTPIDVAIGEAFHWFSENGYVKKDNNFAYAKAKVAV